MTRSISLLLLLLASATKTLADCGNVSSGSGLVPYAAHIRSVANRYGIDSRLVRAVIRVESDFNPYARSHHGARGLMQLMPETQREMGVSSVYDPKENIDGGVRYLVRLLLRYRNLRKALWAYNAGPGRVDRGEVPAETVRYANRVMRLYDCYRHRDQERTVSLLDQ